MKKLLLFVSAVALTVSLNSCSSSSDGGGSMSFKVGGVKKSFKTEAYSAGGTTFVYGYTGNINTPTETVDFDVASGTGADKISGFYYDSTTGGYTPVTLTSNVTTNTASSVKGTYSGTFGSIGGGADVVITEGTFSAKVTTE